MLLVRQQSQRNTSTIGFEPITGSLPKTASANREPLRCQSQPDLRSLESPKYIVLLISLLVKVFLPTKTLTFYRSDSTFTIVWPHFRGPLGVLCLQLTATRLCGKCRAASRAPRESAVRPRGTSTLNCPVSVRYLVDCV